MVARERGSLGSCVSPGPFWNQPLAGAGEFNGEAPDGYPRGDLNLQASPDCYQALCVKPECTSCVGCNRVDCGYMADAAADDSALTIGEPFSSARCLAKSISGTAVSELCCLFIGSVGTSQQTGL